MANEAPQDGRERHDGETDAAAAPAPGLPEGFEPPAAPGEAEGARPWPTVGQEAAGQAGAGDPTGAKPWPSLGKEAADQPPPSGYGVPEYHGYQAGPGGPPPRPRRLYRSEHDRVIAGVCGGLSHYLGVDANLLRVAFALLAIFAGGSGLLIYVILWALVPRESRIGLSPSETAMDAVNEVRDRFQGLRRA
jgi:phage shock protein PspC (stress-responsive transcriptional regulator)